MKKIRNSILILGIVGSITAIAIANNFTNYGPQTIIYEQNTPQTTNTKIYNNEINLGIIRTQIAIGKGNYDIVPNSEIIALLQKTAQLANTNIIKSLEMSNDKDTTLQTYLQESRQITKQGEQTLIDLKQELLLLQSDIEDCLEDKILADKHFFDALKNYNSKRVEESIKESQHYAQCASDKRIQFNAQTEIQNRLNYYYEILSKKLQYLSIKESHIIQDFDDIKYDVIQELNNELLLNNL